MPTSTQIPFLLPLPQMDSPTPPTAHGLYSWHSLSRLNQLFSSSEGLGFTDGNTE